MRRCRRRRNTPRSKGRAFSRCMMLRIRAPARSDSVLPLMTVEPEIASPPIAAQRQELPLGYAFAAIGALLFSMKGIIIKIAYGYGISPDALIALRMAFSLPVYLAVAAFAWRQSLQNALATPSLSLIARAMLIGVLGVWFASYVDFIGLTYISAQFERLILFTYPLFVVLFGALFFDQMIRARALAALGVSYIGLAAIFTENLVLEGQSVVIGSAFVI